MTRSEVLTRAGQCVNGERDQQYGSPERSFQTIAALWNSYLMNKTERDFLSPVDVAAMLSLLKIARISTGAGKDDNWVDLAGYAACGGELQGE